MPRSVFLAVAALAIVVLFRCSGGPARGEVGADCPNDNNCKPSLFCDDGECALRPRDGGVNPGRDAGVIDAGERDGGRDAGPRDGGPRDGGPRDAGCNIAPTLSVIQADIFGANSQPACSQNACHGGARAGDIRLDTPIATLRADLLGPTRAGGAPQTSLVVPGDPAQSRLWVIMSQANPGGGGSRMPPPPANLVDECDQQAVREWIEAGALEN